MIAKSLSLQTKSFLLHVKVLVNRHPQESLSIVVLCYRLHFLITKPGNAILVSIKSAPLVCSISDTLRWDIIGTTGRHWMKCCGKRQEHLLAENSFPSLKTISDSISAGCRPFNTAIQSVLLFVPLTKCLLFLKCLANVANSSNIKLKFAN